MCNTEKIATFKFQATPIRQRHRLKAPPWISLFVKSDHRKVAIRLGYSFVKSILTNKKQRSKSKLTEVNFLKKKKVQPLNEALAKGTN